MICGKQFLSVITGLVFLFGSTLAYAKQRLEVDSLFRSFDASPVIAEGDGSSKANPVLLDLWVRIRNVGDEELVFPTGNLYPLHLATLNGVTRIMIKARLQYDPWEDASARESNEDFAPVKLTPGECTVLFYEIATGSRNSTAVTVELNFDRKLTEKYGFWSGDVRIDSKNIVEVEKSKRRK